MGWGSDRDQGWGLYCDGWWQDSTCCPTSQCCYVDEHLPGSSFCLIVFGRVSPTHPKNIAWTFLSEQPNRVTAINCKICGFSETEAVGFNLKAATYFVGFAGLFIYRFFMLRNLWDCLFIAQVWAAGAENYAKPSLFSVSLAKKYSL